MGVATSTDLLRLSEAAKRVPGNPSAKILHRWGTEGLMNRTRDNRFFLELIKIGGKVYTTNDALETFLRAVSDRHQPTPIVSPAARDRATRAAELSLHRKGYRAK